MGRIIRSQKKGKIKQAYNSRYTRGGITIDKMIPSAIEGFTLTQIKKDNLGRLIGIFTNNDVNNKIVIKNRPLRITLPENVQLNDKLIDLFKPLKNLEVGSEINNIEVKKNKRIICAPGTKGIIFEKTPTAITIILPSKKKIVVSPEHRAMLGVIAGGFKKTNKIFGTAGNRYHYMKKRGKKYPTVSANKMNVVDHFLGGSYRKARGRPLSVSRNKSPGAKGGQIASRRTGYKK